MGNLTNLHDYTNVQHTTNILKINWEDKVKDNI